MALGKRFSGGLVALAALGLVLSGCTSDSASKQSSDSPASGETFQSTTTESQSSEVLVKEEVFVDLNKELPLFDNVEGEEISLISPGEYILAKESGTSWILIAERSDESDYPVVLGWVNVSEEGSSSYQQSK